MTAPASIESRLDSICRRQTARFLDHLRATRQATQRLESDTIRFMGFIFKDVKTAIRERSEEAPHAQPANR
ncbi:MAG: hypothetical protein RBT03_05430 [Kiritimatiellia bacterium]|nr:hypothetical protein [Kiritimatiellia bacterium]